MYKFIALFALLAVASAAPAPKPDPAILAYSAGVPLAYEAAIPSAIPSYYNSWNNIYAYGGLRTYAAAYPSYTSYSAYPYSGLSYY